MNMKMMSKCILVPKSCIVYFFIFPFFSNLSLFIFPFPIKGLVYQDYKQYVGAGINTLMSISDGLGPSIFCRKMEKARPMMEEMDGRVGYFPPQSAYSDFDVLISEVLFPICISIWRVSIYVSRQEKV